MGRKASRARQGDEASAVEVGPAGGAPPAPPEAVVSSGDDANEGDNAERLAAALGLRFRDPELLHLALTHRSVGHDLTAAGAGIEAKSNERLEFLGDAVLGTLAAQELYERYPDATEGELTTMRVAVVRAEQLVLWARELRLAEYLYLGQGERVSESARDRMLAGAFEALIGALYLDRGLRETRRFLRRFLLRDLLQAIAVHGGSNPKGRLQEVLQERFRQAPSYRIAQVAGPAHGRVFTVEVMIGERRLATGDGRTKREAEQTAARAALDLVASEPPPEPAGCASASCGADG